MSTENKSNLKYWVTGASSGLGLELARQLADLGHTIYATARNETALQSLAKDYPDNIIPLPCDVTCEEAMTQLFKSGSAPEYLDAVIISAGICIYSDVDALDLGAVKQVMDVNFYGAVHACKAALPLLRAASDLHPGRKPEIVAISSLSTIVGFPRNQAYGSSKAALEYFMQALRCDVGDLIQVTTVQPGFISTSLTDDNDFPMPFMMLPQTAAAWIIRHLGRSRNRLRFPWQLSFLLRLSALLPQLWYGPVMNKLARQRKKLA